MSAKLALLTDGNGWREIQRLIEGYTDVQGVCIDGHRTFKDYVDDHGQCEWSMTGRGLITWLNGRMC